MARAGHFGMDNWPSFLMNDFGFRTDKCSQAVFSCLVCLISLSESAPASETHSYRWVCISMKAPFPARDGAGALVFRDRMWLLGGWDSRNDADFPLDCVNDVWSSSDGKAWIRERGNTFGTPEFNPDSEWEGRHTAGYAPACR